MSVARLPFWQAGTSSDLDMKYNKGLSSWSHSHIITYQNGKRAMLTMRNGKYRAGMEPVDGTPTGTKERAEWRIAA